MYDISYVIELFLRLSLGTARCGVLLDDTKTKNSSANEHVPTGEFKTFSRKSKMRILLCLQTSYL